jgi:hypothetical protein
MSWPLLGRDRDHAADHGTDQPVPAEAADRTADVLAQAAQALNAAHRSGVGSGPGERGMTR